MRLWEELSGIIFKKIAGPYFKPFREKNPEIILRQSLEVIDPEVQQTLTDYIRNCQDPSGGFKDRGGKPDIYYTLFGYFLAEALNLRNLFPSLGRYTENEIRNKNLSGVYLYCAAILYSKLGNDNSIKHGLKIKIREQLKNKDEKQPAYRAFISLLACYYLDDYHGIYILKKQLEKLNSNNSLPSPVVAALLVLKHSFGKNVEGLKKELLSFISVTPSPLATLDLHGGSHQVPPGGSRGKLSGGGGFKAVKSARVPDLLSTAVSLYALRFAGHDLRMIKPGCLDFIDLLYKEGGFSANLIDPDPDIEYTFYGFLALGSLADSTINFE